MMPLRQVMNYPNGEEVVMVDKLHLTNMLRAKVEYNLDGGLPLDVFPDKIQEIILNLSRYENFNVEYVASIIISAMAAAIGNSYQINIRNEWKDSPSLYMMLIGRPGLGKTPPLNFLYKPINDLDDRLDEKYSEELEKYECAKQANGGNDKLKVPKWLTKIISDFTPEAMVEAHWRNPRGIAIIVDEIIGLFNFAKRYNGNNNLIELLLTAYSGGTIKVLRKSSSRHIRVKTPCINVIGTVQTNMLHEVFRKEFIANGFLDRFIFIFPKDRKISRWRRNDNSVPKPDIAGQWATILNKVLEIPCTINETRNVAEPKVLEMTEEAEVYFYDWYNNIIDNVNSIDDDADVESRSMKLNGHAGRLSLIFQIMKWAVGEGDMQPVSLSSVKSAIRMVDYYEDTYHRIQEILLSNTIGDVKEDWLSQLGNTFTASDAIAAAKIYEIPRRTVFYALKKLCQAKQPILKKNKHGEYRKIQHQTSNASCTIALSTQVEELQTKHSAKVHSANE